MSENVVIKFGKGWRIRTDPMNWMLERSRIVKEGKTAGEEAWDSIGFYDTLDSLIAGYVNASLKRSGSKTLKALGRCLADLAEDVQEIRAALSGGRRPG